MLLALTCGFILSQAWRTVAAIMAVPLQAEFGLSAQQLGLVCRGISLRLWIDAARHGHQH